LFMFGSLRCKATIKPTSGIIDHQPARPVSCIRRQPIAIEGMIIAIETRVPKDEKIADEKSVAITLNRVQYQYAEREALPLKFA